ncbi:hypothetical protein G6F50_016286 [Rhizopus delemar]|uniref:Uncharacterized protein n=1 Tax=Rhizopus delemar TaxID=936053 RepID=A0A9P7C1H8_9FUNG|nr:hypothetical protein G6F50_016286 [Rhizopus delemar]
MRTPDCWRRPPPRAARGRGGAAGLRRGPEARGPLAGRRGAGDHGIHIPRGRVQMARQQGGEHRFLAGEVGIEAAFGQAGLQRDVVHPRAGIAGLRESLQCRVQNLPDAHGRR